MPIEELVIGAEGKTDSKTWYTDGWEGYERVLPPEVIHVIGKENTQRLERTNGIIRQQIPYKTVRTFQSPQWRYLYRTHTCNLLILLTGHYKR